MLQHFFVVQVVSTGVGERKIGGDTVGAIDSFRQPVLLDPGDALAQANLGNILAAMHDIDGAATHYRQTLALVPDAPQLHHELGQVLQAMGCIEEAHASFLQAQALAQALAQGHPNTDCQINLKNFS